MRKVHDDLMSVVDLLKRFPRIRALLLGVLSASFLIASFPFFVHDGLWWLAVLIPLPLMVLASDPVLRPSRAALFAGVGTLPAWAWTHHWMWGVSKMGTPFLLLYLAFFAGLFVWVGARVHGRFGRAWITLPMVWVGIEFLRAHAAFTGYPWYLSSQPLIHSPGQVLAGPAALSGTAGMYVVGLLSAVFAWQFWGVLLLERYLRRLACAVVILGGWIGLGLVGLSNGDESEVREVVVGIVQPNVPQDNRMDWTDRQRYADWLMLEDLTLASAQDRGLTPELIVWPEGLVPGWTFDPISLEHEREHGFGWNLMPRFVGDAPNLVGVPERIPATTIVDELIEMQAQIGIPMVVGSVAFENLDIQRDDKNWVIYENDGMYNSAFVVRDGSIDMTWYNKMHLTPFGEVMPVISNWEWLETMLLGLGATGMEFILSAGDEATVLDVPLANNASGLDVVRVGAPICFEATVPGVCSKLVYQDGIRQADLMVNLTNDGWFGDWDPARRSHQLIARWRCVELRTPMIRSANTGVSCVIDAQGAVVAEELTRSLPQDPKGGYLNHSVSIGGAGVPWFARWIGRIFGWGMLGGAGLLLILSLRQNRSEPAVVADE